EDSEWLPRHSLLETAEEDYCRVEGVSGCGVHDFHDCGSRTAPALS
ncbi:hypothetical protein A2U01_0113833, partial [Trifolium medium]|nr:hypothetical protein [Trifolium medium]